MKRKTFLSLSAACAAGILFTFNVQAEVKVGDACPDFKLKGSDGKTYKLSDFKGKQAVVIAWYPKAFTGGCTKQCRNFAAEGAALRKYDVAYFTASVDSVKLNTDFAKSLNADYAILSDPKMDFAKALGVLRDGRPIANRWTYIIGKNGKILHIDKKVNVSNHAQDIAVKLAELGVPKATP